jgi:integrase
MRITDTWLRTLKRPKARYDVTTELRGLMVRVHESGVKSFRFRYRHRDATGKSSHRILVLGEYGKAGLSLNEAHEWQRKCQRWLTLGLDPIEERGKEQAVREQEHHEAGSVAELVEQFVHRKLKGQRWDEERGAWERDEKNKTRPRKRPEAAAALLGYFEPPANAPRRPKARKSSLISKYGKVRARELTKRQLVALLDEIVDRGAAVNANRTYALLKQLFAWAAAKDLVPASPMAGIERPGGDESARDRVLTGDELRTFWTQLDTADMREPVRLALRVLLLTAQRRGELADAKWAHFDLEERLWTIPVELLKSSHRRKKPQPHRVPLAPFTVRLLESLKGLTGESEYVLPAFASKKSAIPATERMLSRAIRRNDKHFGLEHFTPHDLRRTAASHMTRLGVPRLHVEKVLNHATGDIAEIYDRHDYAPEKKAALEKWAAHLQELVAGKERKVSPMPRRA